MLVSKMIYGSFVIIKLINNWIISLKCINLLFKRKEPPCKKKKRFCSSNLLRPKRKAK